MVKTCIARPTIENHISGECSLAVKDAEAQRNQNPGFRCTAVRKPFQAAGKKAFLLLSGEAGQSHGFLCVTAPLREEKVLGVKGLCPEGQVYILIKRFLLTRDTGYRIPDFRYLALWVLLATDF